MSQDYLDSRIPIARQQLAKGGYRLADYLRGIMDDIEVQKAAEAYFMEWRTLNASVWAGDGVFETLSHNYEGKVLNTH